MIKRITVIGATLAALAVPAAASAATLRPFPATGQALTAITAFHDYTDPAGTGVDGTLTLADGTPLAGQLVTFTEASRTLCSATTGADGFAECTLTPGQVGQTRRDGGIFTATFAGTATLAPASRAGHI